MEERASKTFIHDFTSGSVVKALFTFAVPIFLSNLLQVVYNMVDMVVVGKVVGEAGLSGIAVGGDLLNFLTFLSMGFSNASQVIIAQYIGAGWRERISRFIGTMFSFLMICAAVLSVICLILREQILGWLNTPAESWDQAMAYAVTCISGLIFIYGYNTISAVLRGMGDSRHPCLFIAIAAVVNLLLDLLFVAGLGLEAFGAALATVMAQAISFLCSVVYLYRRRDRFGFDFARRSFRINPVELLTLVKLGVPTAIRSAAVQFSKLFVSSWVNSCGVTVSAVFGIGAKLETISHLLGEAITAGGSSMVGQNIGAGKYGRVTHILGVSILLSAACISVPMAAVAFFPRFVFGIFTDGDPAVMEVCMEYIPVALTAFAACAARAPMNGFTHGCGNYKFNFCLAVLDGVVGRIGLSMLLGLGLGMGYFGFWMGSALAGFTPFVLGGIYYLTGFWKKKSGLLVEDPQQA